MRSETGSKPLVGLVGPCKSGKTLLKRGLQAHGYQVRHIAQEHSFVLDMWRRISNPDVLIFLEVSYPTTMQRSNLTWHETEYRVQLERLAHARAHADLIINTDQLSPQQVLSKALHFLETK